MDDLVSIYPINSTVNLELYEPLWESLLGNHLVAKENPWMLNAGKTMPDTTHLLGMENIPPMKMLIFLGDGL